MAENQDDLIQNLTFSQRQGFETLPEYGHLEFLSDDLRRELCNVVYLLLIEEEAIPQREKIRFFAERLGEYNRRHKDEYSGSVDEFYILFKHILANDPFNRVLDLIERILNKGKNKELAKMVQSLFEQHSAAYFLDLSKQPYMFFPHWNKEQGDAIREAINILLEKRLDAPARHLREAVEHIKAKNYGDSIADSIHAVESVARSIDTTANSLGQALNNLERRGLQIHPALRNGFISLYGYTSDEQGIRHALIDKESPEVGLDETMFMLGACASFATYLVSKHQKLNSGS